MNEENEERIERVNNFFKPAKIGRRKAKKLEEVIDESDLMHVDRRDIALFHILEGWYQHQREYYLLLPQNFFPKVKEREKRKRIRELKLSRKKQSQKE